MGFDAARAVEPLDYDFSAFGGSVGVINEPSTGQVDDFFNSLKALAREARGMMATVEKVSSGEMSEAEALDTLSAMDDDLIGSFRVRILDSIDGLCNGTPTREEIEALPYRVLNAFNTWLGAQLRPEAQRSAGKR